MVKSKKTRIILLIAVVAVAAALTAGIMALAGVFHSDKAEAVKLLAQMRERLSWSSTSEYVGAEEIAGNLLQKGGSVDLEMSQIQFDANELASFLVGDNSVEANLLKALFGNLDWSDYVLELNTQFDIDSGRTSNTMMFSKGENRISVTQCEDEDERWVALPELMEGKVFHITKEESGIIKGKTEDAGKKQLEEKDVMTFFSDLKEAVSENIYSLQESITCDKIRKKDLESKGDAGYILIIPKDTINSLLTDLADVFKKQKNEIFQEIGQNVETWSASQDIELKVYGEDNILRRIECAIPVSGETYELVTSFEGEKGDSSVTLTVGGTVKDVPVSVAIKMSDKKEKKCENTMELTVTADGQQAACLKMNETVTPESGGYHLDGSVNLMGNERYRITADGSIKDLKQGICASYILDDVKVSSGDSELISMAMNLRFASKEGSLEPPQGETVEITSDTTEDQMEQYKKEIQSNLREILSKMELFSFDGLISGGLF